MIEVIPNREEKQKEWESLLKKYRLLFITHGDDLLLERLERLQLYRVNSMVNGVNRQIYFYEGENIIQFRVSLTRPIFIWMYSCLPGTFATDAALLHIYGDKMKGWYRETAFRFELHDFFTDLHTYLFSLTTNERGWAF